MTRKDAAQEAGSILGWNEKTVRRYRKEFFDDKRELIEMRQGKHMRTTCLPR